MELGQLIKKSITKKKVFLITNNAENEAGRLKVVCSLFSIYFDSPELGKGRLVGLFRRHTRKTIKKSLATGMVQKSCTALFPLWSLRKNDLPKMKNNTKRKCRKH